jgi:signal transduction histidine kinase/PAS domain-containing protein
VEIESVDEFLEHLHPEHRDRVTSAVRAAVDTADGTSVECRARPDLEPEWIALEVEPIEGADGTISRIIGLTRDISDRKDRQRTLGETNAVLSTLFETLPVGVLVEDDTRTVRAANDRLFELFGFSDPPENVIGMDCRALAEQIGDTFADPDDFVERIDDLVTSGESADDELSLSDGRTFERSHRLIDLPEREGHLWMYRDVTDRTEREADLRALNETTQDLMTAETRGEICERGVEAAATILGLDANAIHLYNEERDALVPIAATDVTTDIVGEVPTFTGGNSIAWRVYQQGEALALNDAHDDPDVYDPDTPVRSELHLPLGNHGILLAGSEEPDAFDQRDLVFGQILADAITTALDQRAQTERLRERERDLKRQNERLEEFTSVVSHDLRNPLNVAIGRLDVVREECESEHLDVVARAHNRMEALIDDLLTLARQGEAVSETELVDLATLADGCWENVATADATLVTDIDRRIRADRSRLQQLLENLMLNAIDHGGEDVTVTVGALADGFSVEDDGPGIPADDRAQVFEMGYSTAEDGTGFGLSIVEEVADAHGWDVHVTDGATGGARFEITGVSFVDS